MGPVLDKARADVDAGRLWKARDRLVGALVHRFDDELLDLLGDVAYAMGDLPLSGAMCFATGRRGTLADIAMAAWRERYGSDDLQLFLSLPPLVRRASQQSDVVRLREELRPRIRPERVKAGIRRENDGWRWNLWPALLVVVVLLLLVCVCVGAVTLARLIV